MLVPITKELIAFPIFAEFKRSQLFTGKTSEAIARIKKDKEKAAWGRPFLTSEAAWVGQT